jgi:MFS superfamily sulfate permease-like transporter
LVLLVAIPYSLYMHFSDTEPGYSLVKIGDFWGSVGIHVDFSMIGTFAFWKYVLMFLFVSSLESLLTVKAMDNLDPYRRESDYNGDLKAQGAGNALSGLLGGLPMISEVVRSSANITFGAQTKWSNFFHGIFLLLAMFFLIPVIEMIPNAALAAMLIFAGYRLAAPKEFVHVYHIGKEQLAIFLTTIIITLAEDLLLGVVAGILVKIIFHFFNGAPLKSLFKANYKQIEQGESTVIKVEGSAVFSNLLGFKKMLMDLPNEGKVKFDLTNTLLIDHSFLSFITHFAREYQHKGGEFEVIGLEGHRPLSPHPLATRKRIKAA